jgi:hypothetical protein
MSDNTDPRIEPHVELSRHLKRGCLLRRAAYYFDIAESWRAEVDYMRRVAAVYVAAAVEAEEGDCDDR